MHTTSLDLRQRILASYDNHEGSRLQIAHRFRVSLGLVKKLLQQRRTGDIAPRHRYSGRKPMIVDTHRRRLRALLTAKNDLTLQELREATQLQCSLQALHVVLAKMGLTYKKRHSGPVNKTDPTSPGRGGAGKNNRRAGTRPS